MLFNSYEFILLFLTVTFLVFFAVPWFGHEAAFAWLVFPCLFFSAWWTLVPVAAFGALIVVHDKVIRSRKRAQRVVEFYESGLARLGDRWAGTGTPGTRFADSGHPYAHDLDLFGPGSLFELL